jgi:hypothetical protein
MIALAAVMLAVGALVFTLTARTAEVSEPEPASPEELAEQRRTALEEGLRDLEFEYRLGKLSKSDYLKTRQDMERELAQLGEGPGAERPRATAPALVCPHCGARFPTPLKFCGECGKPMRREA